MALIMYLTNAPKYQNIVTDEYETIPRDDIVLIDKYFNWKRAKAEGRNSGDTLEEWCGIPESQLASTYVVNHYSNFYEKKTVYHEHIGEVEVYSVFDQLARIVKANQIFRWFIENVMSGKPDDQYHEVSAKQLFDLLSACKVVKKGFQLTEHDPYYGDKYSVNEKVAHKYLPLLEEQGYFFGTNEYGFNYATNVIDTIDILENILQTTNFEQETVYFNATW